MEESLRNAIRRGIKYFLFISVSVTLIVFALTVERKTFEALSQMRVAILLSLLFVWGLYTLFDGLRLHILTKTNGKPIGIRRAIEVILTGYFLAAVTPFQTGGFPVQLLIMNKEGISPGKGMALLTFRGILIYGPIYIAAPFIFLTYFGGNHNIILKVLFRYFAFVFFLIILGSIFAFIKPEWAQSLLEKVQKKVRSDRLKKLLSFIITEIQEFRSGFIQFSHGRNLKYFTLAFFISLLSLFFYLSLIPIILYGLGLDPKFPESIYIQMLLMALLLFIPTPGAGGVAEAGGAALYALICPKHLLGIFIILWRFFTFYLGALIGGLLTLKEL